MLYDKLWEIAGLADWSRMTVEFNVSAVGAFVVAVALIWTIIRTLKRMRTIETRLGKMQKEINTLQMQESRRLMAGLNRNSEAGIDADDVAGMTVSPPTSPHSPNHKIGKISGTVIG